MHAHESEYYSLITDISFPSADIKLTMMKAMYLPIPRLCNVNRMIYSIFFCCCIVFRRMILYLDASSTFLFLSYFLTVGCTVSFVFSWFYLMISWVMNPWEIIYVCFFCLNLERVLRRLTGRISYDSLLLNIYCLSLLYRTMQSCFLFSISARHSSFTRNIDWMMVLTFRGRFCFIEMCALLRLKKRYSNHPIILSSLGCLGPSFTSV